MSNFTKGCTSCHGCQYPLVVAGLTGGLGVVLGALGSHAFFDLMDAEQLKEYNTANQYHLIHSIAMLVVAGAAGRATDKNVLPHLCRAYAFFFVGTLLRSGARYVLSTVHKPDWLACVSSGGSVLLALGWASVAAAGATCSVTKHA